MRFQYNRENFPLRTLMQYHLRIRRYVKEDVPGKRNYPGIKEELWQLKLSHDHFLVRSPWVADLLHFRFRSANNPFCSWSRHLVANRSPTRNERSIPGESIDFSSSSSGTVGTRSIMSMLKGTKRILRTKKKKEKRKETGTSSQSDCVVYS